MVKLEHITYRYRADAAPVLTDVNLDLRPGESVCLMGRNGSGKSTLARVIAGLARPAEGVVTVDGHRLVVDDADRPPVGILFQNPDNQMVATLVEKEIAFALENRAVPQDGMETAITRVCERFEITHLRRRLTSELSGGEKQRVALAAVMIQRPRVLVLDEADAFLDAGGRRVLQDELNAIRERDDQLVEIRITQQVQVSREYDRLIVLDNGDIAADGSPDDILGDSERMTSLGLTLGTVTAIKLPSAFDTEPSDSRIQRVETNDVGFGYLPEDPVLTDVSLRIQRGETVALVGATGAGKSSLGLVISNILKASAGDIGYYNHSGQIIGADKCRGQVVNLLQQSERQFFLSTCAEEVAFGPGNLGRVLSAADVSSFFSMVGLDPERFAGRDPFSLSGGEKRRLAFAAILSMAPGVIVFDEPTAGLDPEGIGRFLAISRALRQVDVGQVLISHSADVVRELAERVVVLQRGRSPRTLTAEEFFSTAEYGHLLARGL